MKEKKIATIVQLMARAEIDFAPGSLLEATRTVLSVDQYLASQCALSFLEDNVGVTTALCVLEHLDYGCLSVVDKEKAGRRLRRVRERSHNHLLISKINYLLLLMEMNALRI